MQCGYKFDWVIVVRMLLLVNYLGGVLMYIDGEKIKKAILISYKFFTVIIKFLCLKFYLFIFSHWQWKHLNLKPLIYYLIHSPLNYHLVTLCASNSIYKVAKIFIYFT